MTASTIALLTARLFAALEVLDHRRSGGVGAAVTGVRGGSGLFGGGTLRRGSSASYGDASCA